MTNSSGTPSAAGSVWNDGDPMASLAALYGSTCARAQGQIDWYKSHVRWKRRFSWALRAFALIFIGIGSLLPLALAASLALGLKANQVYFGWGYVAFAIAAGCVGFDKFFGFSSGWLRYIKTQLILETGLDQFGLDWASLVAKVANGKPSQDQVQTMIKRLQSFAQFADSQVQQETDAWILEFQTNLAELAKAAEAKAQAQRPGQVLLSVTNAGELDQPINATIDGVETKQAEGGQITFFSVSPGDHRIVATGSKGGQLHSASQTVHVPPGGQASVSMTLAPPNP